MKSGNMSFKRLLVLKKEVTHYGIFMGKFVAATEKKGL